MPKSMSFEVTHCFQAPNMEYLFYVCFSNEMNEKMTFCSFLCFKIFLAVLCFAVLRYVYSMILFFVFQKKAYLHAPHTTSLVYILYTIWRHRHSKKYEIFYPENLEHILLSWNELRMVFGEKQQTWLLLTFVRLTCLCCLGILPLPSPTSTFFSPLIIIHTH